MNDVVDGSALFEAFNAKYLEPGQVADGYVYSKHLEELSGPYHAVLIGPRGSGKTTLLKMLQPPALAKWKGARARAFRERIDYSGVFIASDISWSRQLSSLGYGRLDPTHHKLLVLACFTSHVLHAVLDTMIGRVGGQTGFRDVGIAPEAEQLLSAQVLSLLKLKAPIASLLSTKQALRARLSEIRQLANRGSLLDPAEFTRTLADTEYLHLDFLDICSNLTGLFNDAVGEPGGRWALLFDELETAPEWIVEQLFTAFRVSDPKIYLKLAISPVSLVAYRALMSAAGPAESHDHRQIPLWYTDRVEAKSFCESLWSSLTAKHGLRISARDALGASAFEPAKAGHVRKQNPYAPGQQWAEVFASLHKKDRTFAAFLRAKRIDLGQIGKTDQRVKDVVLRKAAPIAAVRDYFLHEDQRGNVRPRFRKTSVLYAGAESIFAISEGNPRWLIGLLTPMISHMLTHKVRRVPDTVQADEIDNAADRLLALLRTIPVPIRANLADANGLDHLVQKIGLRLHDDLLERPFSVDPRLSFIVDRGSDKAQVELLSFGLNRGAVMLVQGTDARSVVGDMTGATLRLSYLLAAKYGLPLRKGKATHLSVLLGRPSDSNQLGFEEI